MKQVDSGRCTRRHVLKLAAAAGSAVAIPWFAPASVLGRGDAKAPSERIGLGFIGIGRMGQGHLRCFLEYPEAHVLAVADVDRWRRDNAKQAVDKTYGDSACGAYNDLRELLARGDIDAVLIATGDRWHSTASILAARAGKDIYCEKPMTLTIEEALAAEQAVRRYGRVFQTGLQQRSTPEFRRAVELIRAGRIGRVKTVHVGFPGSTDEVNPPAEPVPDGLDWDLWIGPAPWRPYNSRFHPYGDPQGVVPWHFSRDFGAGNLSSNTVHAFDVVEWGLGMDESGPVEVIPPGVGGMASLTYRYADGTVLHVHWKLDPGDAVPEGWDPQTAFENFGALYVGEEGWIHVGRQGYLKAYPEKVLQGAAGGPREGRPVPDHHHDWMQCIRTRERTVCDVAVGGRSTIVSHLGTIAHRTARALRWDPARCEFVGDDEANRMRSRPPREPWSL
jgi:predicted dehydrogenase